MVVSYSVFPLLVSGSAVSSAQHSALRFLDSSGSAAACSVAILFHKAGRKLRSACNHGLLFDLMGGNCTAWNRVISLRTSAAGNGTTL